MHYKIVTSLTPQLKYHCYNVADFYSVVSLSADPSGRAV
jgi:hypothetical protein